MTKNAKEITESTLYNKTFTVEEIEWMATGGVIVKDGINYCLSKGVMLYCKDMDHDIWHSFNGLKGV